MKTSPKKKSQKIYFHLAFPVHNLDLARRFYVEGLGCRSGRESKHSLILNLKGNQIVAQKIKGKISVQKGIYPRHFGLIFAELRDWQSLLRRAKQKGLTFYQEAKIRFAATPIEHRTFFLQDPSGNLLEFKHYSQIQAIFGKNKRRQVGEER